MDSRLVELAKEIERHPYERTGHIYHPLPFPEFGHLKTSSSAKAAYRKWGFICRALGGGSFGGLRVLDIGANAGFYSFNFAKLGAVVDAYERHQHYVDIGRRIVEATGLSVCWHDKAMTEEDIRGKNYDVSLMLSVFQWISRGNEEIDEACKLLEAVAKASRTLFFELGCNYGKSAIYVDECALRWIWRLLNRCTSPKRVMYLGTTNPWKGARRYMFACSDGEIQLSGWQRLVTWALQRGWIK